MLAPLAEFPTHAHACTHTHTLAHARMHARTADHSVYFRHVGGGGATVSDLLRDTVK